MPPKSVLSLRMTKRTKARRSARLAQEAEGAGGRIVCFSIATWSITQQWNYSRDLKRPRMNCFTLDIKLGAA